MNAAEALEIAQKARAPLIDKQYADIKDKIARMVLGGDLYTYFPSLYPEVKERLILEGFEIGEAFDMGSSRAIIISWQKGKITP